MRGGGGGGQPGQGERRDAERDDAPGEPAASGHDDGHGGGSPSTDTSARGATQGPYHGAAGGTDGTDLVPVISKLAAGQGGSGRGKAQVAIVMAHLRDG
ncbi:hypothetical protein GCM10010392_38520 [Streptomyces clavifer]|nr:hypothetical protein GCM10010392_38520 [Streptomyces clavifer]